MLMGTGQEKGFCVQISGSGKRGVGASKKNSRWGSFGLGPSRSGGAGTWGWSSGGDGRFVDSCNTESHRVAWGGGRDSSEDDDWINTGLSKKITTWK